MLRQMSSTVSPHSQLPVLSPARRSTRHWIGAGAILSALLLLVGLVLLMTPPPSSQAAPQIDTPLGISTLSLTANPPAGTASAIAPGQRITYYMTLTNDATASADVRLTNTLPITLQFVSALPAGATQIGNAIVWNVGTVLGNEKKYFTLTAQLPPTQTVLHDKLTDRARVTWAGGSRDATPIDHYVQNAGIYKANVTAINVTNNTLNQAVVGEAITITVLFTIPQGNIAYAATPRVLLEDGLWPVGANHPYTVTTDQAAIDPQKMANKRFTQVEFAAQDVTNTNSAPVVLTYILYARARQNYFLGGQTGEIPHGTRMMIQPILRWCATPGCTINQNHTYYYKEDETDNTTVSVTLVRPNVNATLSHTYLDPAGIGQGTGQVRFTIANQNQTGRPTAYDMVLTSTLSAGLTYHSSNDGNAWTVGGITYITWTVPGGLAAGQTWNGYVTATLPASFVSGTPYTCTAAIRHETLPGVVPDEGAYVNTASRTIRPAGVGTPVKSATPADNVRIGDIVTYTVVTKLGGGIILPTPRYTDTLPKGFHYLTSTLQVQGATVTDIITTVASATKQERVTWYMATIDNSEGPYRHITATYQARLTGLNTAGEPVYAATSAEIKSKQSAPNSATLDWPTRPSGTTYNASKTVLVGQPFMKDTFSTSRIDTPYSNKEIGEVVRFRINFKNTTAATVDAYEAQVCDTLPQGLAYDSLDAFNIGTCSRANLIAQPAVGSEGTICWVIDEVCPGVDLNIEYRAVVKPWALPGVWRRNNASIADYTSQFGDSVPYERHYRDFPAVALPTPAQCTTGCPFTVLGLAGSKTAWQSSANAGDIITYTLAYTDTSEDYNYTGLVITDTYDPYLTFISATPAPDQHEQSARRLIWYPTLAANGSGRITLTMQVAQTVPGTVTAITNTMAWDSDQTIPLEWPVVTPMGVANPHVQLTGPATTHAGATITYTVVYSNNGTATKPVTLTMNYGPYLTFLSSTPLTPVSGDNVFVDPGVPPTGVNRTLSIRLRVNAPLPYTLEQIDSDVTIASPGAPSESDAWTITLLRPILSLQKEGPAVPSGVGQPMQYAITVQNDGTFTATGIVLTDTWGARTSYNDVNTGAGWTNHGTFATYPIPELGIGQSRSVYFLVTVDQIYVFYTNTVSMVTDQTSVQRDDAIVWQQSIATTKSANPDPAFPGRTLTYTIYYTNTGGAALNTIITDHLPSGISYQGHTLTGAGCQSGWQFQRNGQDAIWTCAAMEANAKGQLQIWGPVTAAENTWLVNETESWAHGTRRQIETPLHTRVARPWLEIRKSMDDTRPAAPGDRITYTLAYSNYHGTIPGSDPAYDVVITDRLPTQVTFIACEPAAGCSHSGGLVTWNVGTVPTGTRGTVTLVAQVKSGTHGQTVRNNNYGIRSRRLAPSLGPAVERLILDPHLSISKAAAPQVVTAQSQPITYTLIYTNDGGGTLTGTIITDVLSNKTTFVAATTGCVQPPTYPAPGGTVTCTLGTLEQGQSGVIEIRVINIATEEGYEITNTARIDSDQTIPVTSNQTSVWYFGSGCVPVLKASIASDSPRLLGQGMHFTASYEPLQANTPITYTWNLGGVGTGSGLNTATPVYTYTAAGTYTVTLQVDNPCPQPAVQTTHSVEVISTYKYIYLPVVLKNF